MKNVEQIEYYSSCPSCGAINNGSKFCEYCGATMVKAKSVSNYGREDIEEEYLQEDANLPIIRGKKASRDPFLLFFCPIFGGTFLLVPTIILIVFSSVGIMEPWLIAMLSLFWLIGICGIAPLFVNLISRAKCKNGEIVKGTVRGYDHSMYMINNRPALNVRLRIYEDGKYKILILGTGQTSRQYALGRELTLKRHNKYYMVVEE